MSLGTRLYGSLYNSYMTWLLGGLITVQLLHTVTGQYLNCGKAWEQGGMTVASSNVTTTANFSPSASGYFQKKDSRISRRSFQGSSSKAKDMKLVCMGGKTPCIRS